MKVIEIAMISALKSVAFADTERSSAIMALLQAALDALDEDKEHLVAACVSLAMDRYRARLEQTSTVKTAEVAAG